MTNRTQYHRFSFPSRPAPEDKIPMFQKLRSGLFTAGTPLTVRKAPAEDHFRNQDYMEFLQEEIQFIISECRRNGNTLNTSAIIKLCNDRGVDQLHLENILAYERSQNTDPAYSILTDVSQFLDERNHIPTFSEYTFDDHGNLLFAFNDNSRMRVKAKLNSISASQEPITPKAFHDILISCMVPQSYIRELADYAVALNRSVLKKPDPMPVPKKTGPFPYKTEREDSAQSCFEVQKNPVSESDCQRSKPEAADPEAPSPLSSRLHGQDPLDSFWSGSYPAEERSSVFNHYLENEKQTDAGIQPDPMETAYRQLRTLGHENRSQRMLYCNTPFVFMKPEEKRQITVFSACAAVPEVSIACGNSIQVLGSHYEDRIFTLAVSSLEPGVTVLQFRSGHDSVLKIAFFVF